MVGCFERKKEQAKDKMGKKGASWYIDQGLKKRDERRGGEEKRRPKFKNLVPFLGLLRKKL